YAEPADRHGTKRSARGAAASIAGLRRSTDAARTDPERRRSVPHGLIRPDPIRSAGARGGADRAHDTLRASLAERRRHGKRFSGSRCRLITGIHPRGPSLRTLAAKDNSMAHMSKNLGWNVARTTSPLVLRASCDVEVLSAPGVGSGDGVRTHGFRAHRRR